MKIENSDHFKKVIMEFVQELQDEIAELGANEALKNLQESFNSGEAITFTQKMNKTYKDQGVKDDNGNIIKIKPPANLSSKANWDSSGIKAAFSLTDEEDRWLRSDQLYGNNILKKSGFKYTDG